jgi:hypothetical protein
MALTAGEIRLVLERIAMGRAHPEQGVACPHCGRAGLVVTDRSARPYAEWYHLACAGCGLDETIHVPLGPPVPGGDD